MKRLVIGIMLIAAAATVMAASSVAWEGRAAVGSSDAFPAGGKYAQSRVFSKGEIVDVYNTVNGKTVTVVITGTTDLAGVLILVSPSVAQELDITGGYDTVVRISRKNDFVAEGTLSPAVTASVPDPDTNTVEALKDDLSYTDISQSAPVVQKKKPVTAYEYSKLPDPETLNQSSEMSQTTPDVSSSTTVTPIIIIQTPQVTEPAIKTPASKASIEMPFPELLISDYECGQYYVQIAVYRDVDNIRNVVKKYRSKYPISIKSSESTSNAYEILIGPLSKGEYSAILTKFRKDGYKDAFLKVKK